MRTHTIRTVDPDNPPPRWKWWLWAIQDTIFPAFIQWKPWQWDWTRWPWYVGRSNWRLFTQATSDTVEIHQELMKAELEISLLREMLKEDD